MLKVKISTLVMALGLGACQVPNFEVGDLGVWRIGLSTATDYTESDIDAGGVKSEREEWGHDHSVDVGLSPGEWDGRPFEVGARVSFTSSKDKLIQGASFTEEEVLTLDAVGTLRLYGEYTGSIRPWIEAFAGIVYNDTNIQGVGSDEDIAPVGGGSIGVSVFVGEGVSIESALRYTHWETDLFGLETESDRFSMIVGLAAWF